MPPFSYQPSAGGSGRLVVLARILARPSRRWRGYLRGRMSGLRIWLIWRVRRWSRSGGDIGVLPVRRRVPIPLLRRVLGRRLALRWPARSVPTGGGAVVGLRRRVRGNSVTAGAICAVLVALAGSGFLARLRDRGLECGLGHRLRPLFAAFDRQLAGCLDRRLVGRDTPAEVVEHRQPRPLLDIGEDRLEFGAVKRLLLQELAGQGVEHVAVLGEDLPRFGMRGLDELADLVVDDLRDFMRVVRLRAHGPAAERITMLGAVTHRAELAA